MRSWVLAALTRARGIHGGNEGGSARRAARAEMRAVVRSQRDGSFAAPRVPGPEGDIARLEYARACQAAAVADLLLWDREWGINPSTPHTQLDSRLRAEVEVLLERPHEVVSEETWGVHVRGSAPLLVLHPEWPDPDLEADASLEESLAAVLPTGPAPPYVCVSGVWVGEVAVDGDAAGDRRVQYRRYPDDALERLLGPLFPRS